MNIIFATGNKDKVREIKEIMGDMKLNIISMKEAGITGDIEENGSTFEENAIIKAKGCYRLMTAGDYGDKSINAGNSIIMADDSGLEIDYLNKEPGIYSARYMGKDTSYDVKNHALLERLAGVPSEQRQARYVCAMAAIMPDGSIRTAVRTMEGRIAMKMSGSEGFGYDPIFLIPELGKTAAEISAEEKNAISHRGKALRAMERELRDFLEKNADSGT